MKRLLMIAYHFPPSTAAGAHRSARFARWLPRLGWSVTVLTTQTPQHAPAAGEEWERPPDVERTPVLRPFDLALGLRGAVRRILRQSRDPGPASAPRQDARSGWWQRCKNFISELISFPDREAGWIPIALTRGLRIVYRDRTAVLYTSGPPHSSHLIAWLLKRITGRSWVADFRDPWARIPWEGIGADRTWRQRAIATLERRVVRSSDRVILNTERLLQDFRTAYPKEADGKFICIPNGYDPAEFAPVAPTVRSGPFRITHAGTLYKRRDPSALLTAARRLLDSGTVGDGGIEIEFIGGVRLDNVSLEELAASLGLERHVRFIPRLPHAECLARLYQADVLLVVQPGTDIQIPGKIFEYLYIGKPMLALCHAGATADFVTRYALGRVADPDRPEEVCRELEALYRERQAGTCSVPRRDEILARHHIETLVGELDSALSSCRRERSTSPLGNHG